MPIIFWLMTIEDKKIREAAIRNVKNYTMYSPEYECTGLLDALWLGFGWAGTKEGLDFWCDVLKRQMQQ